MERLTSRDKFGAVINNLTVEKGRASCKDIHGKLAEYEDLEEQGRLIKLSYKCGDPIYLLREKWSDKEMKYITVIFCTHLESYLIFPEYSDTRILIKCTADSSWHEINEIYPTRQEAEQALKGIINNV